MKSNHLLKLILFLGIAYIAGEGLFRIVIDPFLRQILNISFSSSQVAGIALALATFVYGKHNPKF